MHASFQKLKPLVIAKVANIQVNSLETGKGEKYFDVLWKLYLSISLVIRQKGKSHDGGNKKTKHAKFSKKQTCLTLWCAHVCVRFAPWYAHIRVRIREQEISVFSENLACFVFLLAPSWDSPFCLITNKFSNFECIAIIKKRKEFQKWGNNLTHLIYLIRDLEINLTKLSMKSAMSIN